MIAQPFVSVIIPTYNRGKFIKKAIESVLSQTYRNYEIIVVDDGSTDKTGEVLKEFHGRSEIIYLYKENGGVSSARNMGIKKAKGDYIAFLDSDDTWMPQKLERQIEYISDNPEKVMVGTEFVIYDDSGNKLGKSGLTDEFPADKNELLVYLLSKPPLLPSTLMIKKEVFDIVGGFDEDLSTAVDLDFNIRAALKDIKMAIVDESLMKYIAHKDGISKACRSHKNRFRAINKLLDGHPEFRNVNERVINRSLGRAYFNYAKTLLHEGYMRDARSQLTKSFSYHKSGDTVLLYFKSILKSIIVGSSGDSPQDK